VAVTGSTGLIGRHLLAYLANQGYDTIPVAREDYASEDVLAKKLEGAEAVVNLAGAPILRRWTDAWQRELVRSRVDSTHRLVLALGRLMRRPQVLVSASAVGLYPDGRRQTESHFTLKRDFLGTLCLDWEQAAVRANGLGIRTAIVRIGVVLAPDGGMIKAIRLPFSLGLGGRIGDGKQGVSWIHVEDLCRLIEFIIQSPAASGIYNGTAPDLVTNARLTRLLGKVMKRPVILPVPGFALRLLYGKGSRVLTSGQLAFPERALQEGFQFRYATLEPALVDVLSRT